MANVSTKINLYSLYTFQAEQQAELAKEIKPEEKVQEQPTQIAEKQEDVKKPQMDNKTAAFNIYRAGGMRI